MKIGIIGIGVVGSACKKGFESVGHNVLIHDIKLGTSVEDLMSAEIIYICVPSPSNKDGSCNTQIVESVVNEIEVLNFQGVTVIKSTVEIGTTARLAKKYNNNKICFVPEFLRERCAEEDFINHGALLIGSENKIVQKAVIDSHGNLPSKVVNMNPTEAEMSKYFHNVFNAMRVVFANEIYEICQHELIDYDRVLNGCLERNDYSDKYLRVDESLRGYAGVCLPKDTKALAAYCNKNDLPLNIFKDIDKSNERLKKTVFKNMRKN